MYEHHITILPSEYRADPEVVAMLQAFYSRSIEGIEPRLERLGTNLESVKKSLNQYMVNYGHASIGDCATIPIFLENVSILAAKAIQDSPLFNGQECSTRYIELSGKCFAPSRTIEKIQNGWLELYHYALHALQKGIEAQHPIQDYYDAPWDADFKKYNNTVKAKAFDIARAFIPSGAYTNTSWNATIRKAKEHSVFLAGHPLPEVRSIAAGTLSKLAEQFPHSFLNKGELTSDEDSEIIQWEGEHPELYYQLEERLPYLNQFNGALSDRTRKLIASMPRKRTALPQAMNDDVSVSVTGGIDYGCWRELQRHRNGVCQNPLVTETQGIHQWYFAQLERYLDKDSMSEVNGKVMELLTRVSQLADDKYSKQYALPLGTIVPFCVTYGLSEILYFCRLRSSSTVHPILRGLTQQIAADFEFRYDLTTMSDFEPLFDGLNLKRGEQTIVKKETPDA